MQKKIFIKTFGCQMNEYDSNRIYDSVKRLGFVKSQDKENLDCYVLNTCHIRDKAKEKVYHEIGRVKKIYKEKNKPIVVVAGCVAQAENQEMLNREPYIDIVIGPQSYHKINDKLKNFIKDNSYWPLIESVKLKAEEKISENVENGTIKCPCHLAIGQEAIAVAAALSMIKDDKAFGAHRSHAHFLALNDDTFSLFAEVLGRVDGCSKGMGGSMHIIDKSNGFYGSVPIVGATIPMATGAGLSISLKESRNLSISYFGDFENNSVLCPRF